MSCRSRTSAHLLIAAVIAAVGFIVPPVRADNATFGTDLERFATWDSEENTLNRVWSGSAGKTGGGMVLSAGSVNSNAGVEHYDVTPNTFYMITAWVNVQSGGGTSNWWFELGVKPGQQTAANFNASPGTWIIPAKWEGGADQIRSTKFNQTITGYRIVGMSIRTGPADTKLSVGFKLGGSGTKPNVHIDDVHITRPTAVSSITFDETSYAAYSASLNGYRYNGTSNHAGSGVVPSVPSPDTFRIYRPNSMSAFGDGNSTSERHTAKAFSGASWRIFHTGTGNSDASPVIGPLATTPGEIYVVNFWMVRDNPGNSDRPWRNVLDSGSTSYTHVAWRLNTDPQPGDIEGWQNGSDGKIRPSAFHVILEGDNNAQRNYAPDTYAPGACSPACSSSIRALDVNGSRYSTMAYEAADATTWFEMNLRSKVNLDNTAQRSSSMILDDLRLFIHGNETLPGCPAPSAVCQSVTVTLDGGGQATVSAAQVNNGSAAGSGCALAAVDPLKISIDGANFFTSVALDCTTIGPNTVTLRVTQDDGQESTCTAVLTVQPSCACSNLLANGGMESPTAAFACSGTGIAGAPTAWTHIGTDDGPTRDKSDHNAACTQSLNGGHFASSTGGASSSSETRGYYQVVGGLPIGQTLSAGGFFITGNNAGGSASAALEIRDGAGTGGTLLATGAIPIAGWNEAITPPAVTISDTVTVVFRATVTGATVGQAISLHGDGLRLVCGTLCIPTASVATEVVIGHNGSLGGNKNNGEAGCSPSVLSPWTQTVVTGAAASTTDGDRGECGFHINRNGNGSPWEAYLSQTFTVAAGTYNIRLSGWMKRWNDTGSGSNPTVQESHIELWTDGIKTIDLASDTWDNWKLFSGSLCQQAVTSTLQVRMLGKKSSTGGSFSASRFDDIELIVEGLECSPANCDDGNPCTNDSCNIATLTCNNAFNTNPCNDGNACTQTDTCQSGVCVGGNSVVCTALDQCHDAGTCSPGTGVCSNPAKSDGTACDDGQACTDADACTGGTCSGSPTAPTLTSAESVKMHGLTPYGIAMTSTECRTGGVTQLLVTFDKPVLAADTSLNAGDEVSASSTPASSVAVSGVSMLTSSVMQIDLSGAEDRTCLHVLIQEMACDVNGSAGELMTPIVLSQRMVLGDSTDTAFVTSADINQTKDAAGPVSGSNFRSDPDLSGAVDSTDLNLVKSRTSAIEVICP